MAIAREDYQKWGGAAIDGLVADYADKKMRRFVASMTNGELVELLTVAVQLFTNTGSRYRQWIDGAADYAVGQLTRTLVGPHLTGTAAVVPATVPVATAPAHVSVAATPGGPTSGLTGVPASAGSAAFDQTTPGF